MRVLAVLMAGGAGTRLTVLSDTRAKPAVPFGGKYRIIDFTLSNCVNSDIYDIAVLTQYRPHSLNAHIGIGKPWDLDRQRGGVHLRQPYQGSNADMDWYRGTADAVLQNVTVVRQANRTLEQRRSVIAHGPSFAVVTSKPPRTPRSACSSTTPASSASASGRGSWSSAGQRSQTEERRNGDERSTLGLQIRSDAPCTPAATGTG